MIHNTPEVNWKFEYVGDIIFRNGYPNRILTDTGHIDMDGDAPVYQWWLTDHLGNVRVVADSLGSISQTNHYDPYGGEIGVKTFTYTMGSLTPYSATENLFRFGAKEWNETFSDYDFSARYFSTSSARFTTQDPLAEKTPHLSPYAYCAGNPMKFIDPTGESTWVYQNEDGTYTVFGGNINDNDLNVYVYLKDDNGEYAIRGESIGITTSETSFYNSDLQDENKRWGGTIDLDDISGMMFLDFISYQDIPLIKYALEARTNHLFDFKATNGMLHNNETGLHPYRGMPLGLDRNGQYILSSARDIGNMAAGFQTGRKGPDGSNSAL